MFLVIFFWLSIFLIFYVYLGYPLLLVGIAYLGKPIQSDSKYLPSVTLLFSAYNEEKVIRNKIENSLSLDYPHELLEILIVSDGSVDRTVEIARSFKSSLIRIIAFPERRGKLTAINDAINTITNEIILFSDSDNYYKPDVIRSIVKYFSNPIVGAVSGGRNVIGESALGKTEGLYWKYEEFIKKNESRLDSCVGVAGDLLAIRRNLFVSPPTSIINDDFYIALSIIKQGFRVIYAPEARSSHPVASTEKGEIERRARMVAGRYQIIFAGWRILPFKRPIVLWQIISHKYLRPLVPFAMLFAFFINIIIVLQTDFNEKASLVHLSGNVPLFFLFLQLLFYFLAWFGGRIQKKNNILSRLLYLPVFLVNSNYAALIGLYRYLIKKQTVIWKKVREEV